MIYVIKDNLTQSMKNFNLLFIINYPAQFHSFNVLGMASLFNCLEGNI